VASFTVVLVFGVAVGVYGSVDVLAYCFGPVHEDIMAATPTCSTAAPPLSGNVEYGLCETQVVQEPAVGDYRGSSADDRPAYGGLAIPHLLGRRLANRRCVSLCGRRHALLGLATVRQVAASSVGRLRGRWEAVASLTVVLVSCVADGVCRFVDALVYLTQCTMRSSRRPQRAVSVRLHACCFR